MLYRIVLDYSLKELLLKITDEEYKEIRKTLIFLPEKLHDYYAYNEELVDQEGLNLLLSLGLEPKIKKIKNLYNTDITHGDLFNNISASKAIVQVHIPNIGLLSMNRVLLLENSCTDELQEKLDEGWRILAICPPNGTRRPDYILGRNQE
jgi:hypothetical protein